MASKVNAASGAAATNNSTKDAMNSSGLAGNTAQGTGVNRKKQKRRQKQAGRQASSHRSAGNASEPDEDENADADGDTAQLRNAAIPRSIADMQRHNSAVWADAERRGEVGSQIHDNSDDEQHDIVLEFDSSNGGILPKQSRNSVLNQDSNGVSDLHESTKQRSSTAEPEYRNSRLYPRSTYSRLPHPAPPRPISEEALRTVQRKVKDPIWDTSTSEERARIKEFWLALAEGERRSLVKIEKEAVLRKMKEQQKHSCSCTVCGRKRTAIEEELEVLYDAYYEELEQFANNNHAPSSEPPQNSIPLSLPPPPPPRTRSAKHKLPRRVHSPQQSRKASRGRVQELPDDASADYVGDEVVEDGQEYDTQDEEYDADDPDYSGSEPDLSAPRVRAQDFFTFGNSLTVQGGILTVADDLLKNDGQKFIDMMEQLAERRMAREDVSQYASYNVSHAPLPPVHSHAGHNHSPPDDEESYDDEDDEEDYASEEDDYVDEDDTDTMTEDQRMQEGRRMFQIFAARMFEQRVLTAYREKVARERQEKLIQELEADKLASTERELKKARDAEKKKQKKQQQKQAKAEEKARKEEAKAAGEAAQRLADEKRQEEEKAKREEARKKKEAERKAAEEEKQRKEADKIRRQIEEKQRQADAERKKSEEKKRREEAKKKEREEREAKEQEKKIEEKQRAEREEKAKAEKDARQRSQATTMQPELLKRPPQAPLTALPASVKAVQPMNHGSPQAKVATPVLFKATIPVRPREMATRTSHTPSSQLSAPRSPESGIVSKQATPPRPISNQFGPHSSNFSSFRTPNQPLSTSHSAQVSPLHAIAPPPGMYRQQHNSPFSGMGMPVLNGFSNGQSPAIPGVINRMPHVQQPSVFSQHTPVQALHQRPIAHNPPPPGMISGMVQAQNRSFFSETPPGYPTAPAVLAPGNAHLPHNNHPRKISAPYSTQPHEQSGPGAAAQPIGRPAPIKGPTSTKPIDMNGDRGITLKNTEDTTNHLGSSALLDDSDEPIPLRPVSRRVSSAFRNQSMSLGGFDQTSPYGLGGRSTSFDNWASTPISYNSSSYNAPSGWASAQGSGWSNPGAFHGIHHRSINARPVAVRLLATEACRSLSELKQAHDSPFLDVNDLLRQVNTIKHAQEMPIELAELNLILETEGDTQNGGGTFVLGQDTKSKKRLVKWLPEVPLPNVRGSSLTLGEIGSPLPGNSMPFGVVRGFSRDD